MMILPFHRERPRSGYAMLITAPGSYILANSCKKKSVSFEGCANLFFKSLSFDVGVLSEVEFVIGICDLIYAFFRFSTFNNDTEICLL